MGGESQEIEALIQRIVDGEPEAAAELVELWRGWIQNAIRPDLNVTLRVNYGDTQDLIQDLHVKMFFEDLPGDCDSRQAASIVRKNIRRCMADAGRRIRAQMRDAGRNEPMPGSETDSGAPLAAKETRAPWKKAHDADQTERLRRAMRRLPENYRRVLELKEKDMNFVEIGKELGISDEGARKRFHRAVELLHKEIARDSGDVSGHGE